MIGPRSTRSTILILFVLCPAILIGSLTVACTPSKVPDPEPAGSGLHPDAPPKTQTLSPPANKAAPQVEIPLAPRGARFERVSTAEGLSSFLVRPILQDRRGFMWIGTYGWGLNQYDGYQFTVYEHDPDDPRTLSHSVVYALHEDRSGELWVGTASGLDRLERASGTFAHSLEGIVVHSIHEDRAGMLWVGTWGQGLIGYDRATETIEHSFRHDPNAPDDPRALASDYVYTIYEDQESDLWIGTSHGLDRLLLSAGGGIERTTSTLVHYRHDPGDSRSLSDNSVLAILEDRHGALWVGTYGGGLDRMDRSSGTFTHHRHDAGSPHSLGDDRVTSLLEDRTGTLWIGNQNGLDSLDATRERFHHHRHDPVDAHSLSSDLVWSLYEDRSGVVWIGTSGGGLSKYSPGANRFTHYVQGLSDDQVLGIYEDREGVLWIGTVNGGLNRLDHRSGTHTVYRHDPDDPTSLSSDTVYAIYQDHDGTLWVGAGGWLERYDPRTETFLHHWYLGYQVEKIAETGPGELWIGSPGGLFRLERDRATLTHYLSQEDIQAIYADRAGALWVGTLTGGLYLWHPVDERFTNYRHDPEDPHSLRRDAVGAICEGPMTDRAASSERDSGTVWVGTLGGGLNRFDRATQTFAHYTEEDGLPDSSVGCILPDSAGFLWLGTLKGLSRFDPRAETFHNYDERDGLRWGAVAAGICFQSQGGEMYAGGADGFYAFSPEQIVDNPHIPPIVITTFKRLNETVRRDLPPDERIELSYRENYLSFEFAALDYNIPQRNQYAYMMEGIDADWVLAGTRRHADYPNLRPGRYVFRVKGSNNDGIWNEEGAAVQITIAPPFWETWWLRGIVLLALFGGAISGVRLRVKGIEARSRELERQVEQRTTELRREIEQRTQVEKALRQIETEKAVTAERSRLARELHDAVTQTLFSASLIAEVTPRVWALDAERGRQQLEEVRLLTRGALAEMRTLLLELRPEALIRAKMGDLLQQLGRAMSGRTGVPVAVTVEGQGSLPPPVQVALYRIAQEALNNAGKHADASQVDVRFACEPGRASLTIADDGRGFDVQGIPPGHLGLGIMRERAEMIAARLEIESQPGQGTVVRVVWTSDEGQQTTTGTEKGRLDE